MPGVSGELKVRGPPISGVFAKLPGVVPASADEGLLPRAGSENLEAGSCVGSSVIVWAFPTRARILEVGPRDSTRSGSKGLLSGRDRRNVYSGQATTPRRKIWRIIECQTVQTTSVSRPAHGSSSFEAARAETFQDPASTRRDRANPRRLEATLPSRWSVARLALLCGPCRIIHSPSRCSRRRNRIVGL